MFSTPMTSQLVTINRNEILIANGKYCKWGGLPKEWKKKSSAKGTVRYFNKKNNNGIAVIATCPINGEKRDLKILAGELSSSLDDRILISEEDDGYILWQVWTGKVNDRDINMKIAVIKDIGCSLDFSLISEYELDENSLTDFNYAVKGVECKGDLRWK